MAIIAEHLKGACDSQLMKAERMVKRSWVELVAASTGDNIAVPIPMIDHGRVDPRNLLGVVIKMNMICTQLLLKEEFFKENILATNAHCVLCSFLQTQTKIYL